MKVVVKMYKDDVNASNLETELLLLPQIVESMGFDNAQFDVHDLATFFQSLDRSGQFTPSRSHQTFKDNETSKSMFAKFSNNDLPRKSKLETKSV